MERSQSMLGVSSGIRDILEDAEAVAPTNWRVLITGERGVGKNVLARMIHHRSRRAHLPAVTINCAGVSERALESELFGHTLGSPNGHTSGLGLLEVPDWGTVFLDEVGGMSLRMQSMLLRFVDDGGSLRPGSDRREQTVDPRVIALSTRDLLQQVRRHEFHEDLYYRLNLVHLMIPPLRERRQDIKVLFDRFLVELSEQHRVPVCDVTPEAMNVLTEHDWPGNVRELRLVAERVLLACSGRVVTPEDLTL